MAEILAIELSESLAENLVWVCSKIQLNGPARVALRLTEAERKAIDELRNLIESARELATE